MVKDWPSKNLKIGGQSLLLKICRGEQETKIKQSTARTGLKPILCF